MRAAIATSYGPPEVVKLVDLPDPVAGPDEILVRICAASVSSGDWRLRSGIVPRGFGLPVRMMFGFSRLRQPILGADCSGIMQQVGEGVTRFRVGDEVTASAGADMRCHAEYRVFKTSDPAVKKPPNLSHTEAASIPFGGQTALVFLREMGGLKAGERLLVIGASGAVGGYAVQVAKALGAHVTGVTSSRNANYVQSLGADAVVEYDHTDLASLNQRFDAVLDTVGSGGYRALRPLLADKGRLLLVLAEVSDILRAVTVNLAGRHRINVGEAKESLKAMNDLAEMIGDGKIRPAIDTVFAFSDVVKAHSRVDTHRKTGAVILQM